MIEEKIYKEIYLNIDDDQLKDFDIYSFDDFKDYIKNTVLSNIEYDFGININDIFKNKEYEKCL